MLILTVCHVQWARGQNVTHGNSALVGLESADSHSHGPSREGHRSQSLKTHGRENVWTEAQLSIMGRENMIVLKG